MIKQVRDMRLLMISTSGAMLTDIAETTQLITLLRASAEIVILLSLVPACSPSHLCQETECSDILTLVSTETLLY